MLKRFHRDERGQDIIEYALLAALVGIVAIVTWQLVASGVNEFYSGRTSSAGPIQTLSGCTPNPGGGGC